MGRWMGGWMGGRVVERMDQWITLENGSRSKTKGYGIVVWEDQWTMRGNDSGPRVDGWMDGWVDGWKGGRVAGSMDHARKQLTLQDGYVGWWLDERMGGRMVQWMDQWRIIHENSSRSKMGVWVNGWVVD